ncbi:putative phage abortive infection protein [Acinetobacter baumannii]|nr:putative phage abortive infection protein [Acinetobacter baumannii]
MQEIENDLNKDLKDIDKDINYSRIIIFLILIAVVFFFLIMKEVKITDEAQHWGTVGDFFGGILNPIFALFAFYWLTYSVRLQIKELAETRNELRKAAAAQVESARHQQSIAELENENVNTQKELLALQEKTLISQQTANESQQKQIEIQNFERLFFELIKTKNNAISMISTSERSRSGEYNLTGLNVFKDKLSFLKAIEDFYKHYKENEYDIFSSYIGICNQILILLLKNNNATYINIFKATLSRVELEILFISGFVNSELKENIENTNLLENLNSYFNDSYAEKNFFTNNAFFYRGLAFGANKEWVGYFKEYNLCNFKEVDLKLICEHIEILSDYLMLYGFTNESMYVLRSLDEIEEMVSEELLSLETKFEMYGGIDIELNSENLPNVLNNKDLYKYEKLKTVKLSNELYFLLKYKCNIDTLNKVKANLN